MYIRNFRTLICKLNGKQINLISLGDTQLHRNTFRSRNESRAEGELRGNTPEVAVRSRRNLNGS